MRKKKTKAPVKVAPAKPTAIISNKKEFPKIFPFWARLKISKRRTTLVVDKEKFIDKKSNREEDGFVHREATHTKKKGFEKIIPNPDKMDKEAMYLKSPRKLPTRMFQPHNKNLDMPEYLKNRYEKNNKKQ